MAPDVISGRTFSPRVARSHTHGCLLAARIDGAPRVCLLQRSVLVVPLSRGTSGPRSLGGPQALRTAQRGALPERGGECEGRGGKGGRTSSRDRRAHLHRRLCLCVLNIDGWLIRASMVFGLALRRGVRFAVRPAAANVPHARTCRQVQGGISDKRHVDCKSRPMPQAQRRCPTTRAHKSSNRWPYLSFECVCGFAAKQLFFSSNSCVPTDAPAKTQNHV